MAITAIIFLALILTSIGAALFIYCALRIRAITRSFQIEGEKNIGRWHVILFVSRSFTVVSLLHIPAIFLLTDFIVPILSSIAVLIISAIGFNIIVGVSISEVERTRKLLQKNNDVLRQEYGKISEYVPMRVAEIFNKSSLSDLKIGANIQTQSNMLYVDFFDNLALQYHSDETRFYNIFGECVSMAGTITQEYGAVF